MADLGVGRQPGARVDLGGGGDGHGRIGAAAAGVDSDQTTPRPMLALLLAPTPEGYGVGLEWLIYASFLVPVVFLAVVWYFGSRRTV